MKKLALVLVVIVVGIFLSNLLPVVLEADKKAKEEPIPYITSEGTIERVVEGIAVRAFGKTVNWDDRPYTIKEIKKIKQIAGPDEGGYLIEIRYRANDSLSVSWIKKGIFIDAMEFTEDLYFVSKLETPSPCEEIKIYMLKPYLILVDKYGQEKEVQVAKLVLRREISNKVNWENITNEMFETLLINEGQLWVHPALNK